MRPAGDDFTRYVVLLSKAPGTERNEKLICRHVAYLKRLQRDCVLVSAGPFLDFDGGMLILKTSSLEDAKSLASEDPFVKEGARTFEIRTWKLSCEENNHLGMG